MPANKDGDSRMKVGLYFDLRNPDRWRQDPARLHAFTLEAIEEAEPLGADSIWLSEHHLFADDYVSAPLTFLAAAAARTSPAARRTRSRARFARHCGAWTV